MRSQLFRITLISILAGFFHFSSIACIDPGPDTTVRVVVTYDTSKAPCIEEVEIRITNLRFMTENPGKICSCALFAWNAIMQNVVYIAFVDSGTNNPYLGFAAWNASAAASLAWQNSQPLFSWGGYIANVIGTGLSANSPVEFVIRVKAPIGQKYTLNGDSTLQARSLRTDIENTIMGTDEWSNTTNDLVEAHQALYSFNPAKPGNSISYVEAPDSYFTQLDDDILNNIPTGIKTPTMVQNSLKLFPNPVVSDLNITFSLESSKDVRISVFDILGNEVSELTNTTLKSGFQSFNMSTDYFENGVYFLKIDMVGESLTRKIVIN